jgi:hypothetical protein
MQDWRNRLGIVWRRLRGKPAVVFADSGKIAGVEHLIPDFFRGVALDTEPLFLSNESTIWDFDMGTAEDIQQRCSTYAGRPVPRSDLDLPLWQLIPLLTGDRNRAKRSIVP